MNFEKQFVLDNSTAVPLSAQLSTRATVLTVGFANQWILDKGLVVGVDWLVLSVNVSESHEFRVLPNTTNLSASELSRYDSDIQEGADLLNDLSGLPGILILTVGWAF